MSIHPESSFPLLAGDQADVIRIFLELMAEGDRVERASELTATPKRVGPRNDSDDRWLPGEPSDLA